MVCHMATASMFRQHKPVYVDGEPIGCAATAEQAIALLGRLAGDAEIVVTEQPKAFHLRRRTAEPAAAIPRP